MCGSEVCAVAVEHVDPLLAGVVDGLGDDVGGVGCASSGHVDVRRRGAGVFTDDEVRGVDGLALGAVHGGGVGEFNEPSRVVGRYLSIPAVGVQDEAAVLPDLRDGPGLPVRDLKVAVVAAGGDVVTEPDPFTTSGRDDLFTMGGRLRSVPVVADGGVEIGDLVAGVGDNQVPDRRPVGRGPG